jgi:hypothetical protein
MRREEAEFMHPIFAPCGDRTRDLGVPYGNGAISITEVISTTLYQLS